MQFQLENLIGNFRLNTMGRTKKCHQSWMSCDIIVQNNVAIVMKCFVIIAGQGSKLRHDNYDFIYCKNSCFLAMGSIAANS